MAQNLAITQLIDLVIKTGKLDSSALEKDFPKMINQALAKLPGTKAVVSPDIKVNPKFDTAGVAAQLRALMENTHIAGKEGTKEFDHLNKMVDKYASALEKLSKISTSAKFTPAFLVKARKFSEGALDPSLNTKDFQGKLQAYRDYSAQLQAITKQIQRDALSIKDATPNVEFTKSKNALASARRTETLANNAVYTATVTQGGTATAAQIKAVEDASAKRVAAQAAHELVKDRTGSDKTVTGAHIDPELERISRVLKDTVAAIDKAVKVTKDAPAKQEAANKKSDMATDLGKANAILGQQKKEKKQQGQVENLQVSDAVEQARKERKQQEQVQALQLKEATDKATALRKEQEKIAKEAESKAFIERGRAAYEGAGKSISNLDPSDHKATKAYLESQRDFHNTRANTLIDPAQIRQAAAETHHFDSELSRLRTTATHLHPIMDKLGGLLGQFSRYALGYGALYKVTQAFNSMAESAVNLEDKLLAIKAITGSTTTEMSQMSAVIKQVATTSAFDLESVADAVKIIALAGVELKDVPKTVQAVANLASASGTSLQVAADVITTAKAVWDTVSAEDISNKVTQAANVSKLAVEDLQTIFNLGASFAKSANINLDQYLGMVSTLKNSGLKASTIATGSSQLMTELFSPDDKMAAFLSKRYKKTGEQVSAQEAKGKFASFTETDNPILNAVREMQRIGANSADGLVELKRSMDKRGFNALQPLLNNAGAMQETTARMSSAPTAQEAAQVAMESLKKSTANLVDNFNVLAETLSKDAIPDLARLTRSGSEGVKLLNDIVERAYQAKGGLSGDAVEVGGIAGALAGFSRGKGAGKILTTIGGAIGGGALVGGADTATAAAGESDTVRKAIDFALTLYLVSKVKSIARAFKGFLALGAIPEAGAAATTITASLSTGLKSVGTLIAKKIAEKFAVGVIPGIGLVLAGLMTLYDIFDMAANFFSDDDKKKLAELATRKASMTPAELVAKQAEERVQAQQDPNKQFATEDQGPLPDVSLNAKLNKVNKDRDSLKQNLSLAFGAKVTQEQADAVIPDIKELERSTSSDSDRKVQLSKIQNILKGSGDIKLEEVTIAQNFASDINGAINGLIEEKAKRYTELLSKEKDLVAGSPEAIELEAMKATRLKNSPVGEGFRNILGKRDQPIQNTVDALRDYGVEGSSRVEKPVNTYATERANVLDLYAKAVQQNDPALINEGRVNMSEAIRSLISQNGNGAGDVLMHPDTGQPGVYAKNTVVALDAALSEIMKNITKDIDSLITIHADSTQQAETLAKAPKGSDVSLVTPSGGKLDIDPAALAAGVNDFSTAAIESLREGKKQVQAVLDTPDVGNKRNAYGKLMGVGIPNAYSGVNELTEMRGIKRDPNQKLVLDPENQVESRTNTILKKSSVEPVKTQFAPSEQYQANEDKIIDLQRKIDEAGKFDVNAKEGLITQRLALESTNLAEKVQHTQGNGYSPEERDKRVPEADMHVLKREGDANAYNAGKQVADSLYEVEKLSLESKKRALEYDIKGLSASEDALSDAGDKAQFSKESADKLKTYELERNLIEQRLIEIKRKHVGSAEGEAEAAERSRRLESTRKEIKNNTVDYQARRQKVESGSDYFSLSDQSGNTRTKAIGAEIGTQRQSDFARYQTQGFTDLKIGLEKQLSDNEKLRKSLKDTDDSFGDVTRYSNTLKNEIIGVTVSLTEAQVRLDDLHSTVSSELGQVSRHSIGAKIADLPSSLKNLNTNLEGRVTTAVDSATSALAESAIQAAESLLKLKKIPEVLLQAWTDQQVAHGNQAQLVAQGSIGLAAQISSIRNNETDPVRQEMLIKRAQEAQAQAEAIGQTQVTAADTAYQKAQYENSFAGKASLAAREMVTGAATDFIKGMVQDKIAGLFGGGKRGETAQAPLFVQDVNGAGLFGGGKATGVSSGESSGVWMSNLFSGDAIPTTPGGNASSQDPATVAGDKMAGSVTKSLESPWYTGFTDTMSTGFNGFVSGLTESFGGFTGALGVLLGLQNVGGKEDTVSKIQKYIGLAQGVISLGMGAMGAFKAISAPTGAPNMSTQGFNQASMGGGGSTSSYWGNGAGLSAFAMKKAAGGPIYGPGTSTSDSIPAMLSNGEYVLNAKTASAIGHDTLNAWNFQSTRPARFATGGLVGDIQSSVNKAAAATPSTTPSATIAPQAPQSVRVVLVDDQRNVKNYLTSSEGEKVLVDFVRRNSLSLKTVLR